MAKKNDLTGLTTRHVLRKKRFLEVLEEHGSVGEACRAAGWHYNTAYRIRQASTTKGSTDFDDGCFARGWAEAVERSTEVLEETMYDRAVAGDTTAGIFLLKARRPETYGDRMHVTVEERQLDQLIEAEIRRIAADGAVDAEFEVKGHIGN